MPRRAKVEKRVLAPDAKYQNVLVSRLVNKIMRGGKKSLAEHIVYSAFDIIEQQMGRNPVEVFEQALRNATPILEVRPRRVGGATYQVPIEVRAERRLSLALRWLVNAARARGGRSIAEKLAGELMDAARGQGSTVKRKEDTHRMAEANRAFVHYRW